MNRTALRHSLRSITGWFLVALAAGSTVAAYATGQLAETAPMAVGITTCAALVFWSRHRDYRTQAQRRAETAAFNVRVATQRAEHDARIQALDAAAEARRQAREDEARDEIAQGLRCPEWCTDCEDDRAESARLNAAWVAERAARHGHPNAQDLAELEARETVRTT